MNHRFLPPRRRAGRNEGFSLIQLSAIVLAGSIIAVSLLPEGDGGSLGRYLTTMKRMEKIEHAAIQHMAVHGRRPCPASGEYYNGHANFGREDGSPGDCADSGATDGLLTPFNNTNVIAGTVPVVALGLPFEYYYDGWSRPITYVVDKRATEALECVQMRGPGDVRIDNAAGTQIGESNHLLISHGADGHGAFLAGGSTRANRFNSGSTDADQISNTGGLATFNVDGGNPAFLNNFVSREADFVNNSYDDITWYQPKNRATCCVGRLCGQSNDALIPSAPEIPATSLNGQGTNDGSGRALASGDINGDGLPDAVVAASGHSGSTGRVYVYFGKQTGWTNDIDLIGVDGTTGFIITHPAIGSSFGTSAAVGDINADGYDDIIIGAFKADPGAINDAGEAYVVFGKASGWATSIAADTLNGTNGFIIPGLATTNRLGISSSIADVNGDGYDDVIVGALESAGMVYVIFGKSTSWASSFDLTTLNGTNGFMLDGTSTGDNAGTAVVAANINGDAYADIVFSAPGRTEGGRNDTGAVYVIFGKASGWVAVEVLTALNGTNGFSINGLAADDKIGNSVYAADVNGDRFDDVIIGARLADPGGRASAGQAYVVFGKSSGWGASLELSTLNGTDGFIVNGVTAADEAGYQVTGGDINGDGYAEVVIGAYLASPNAVALSGQTYVVFGKATGWSITLELSALNGTNGFALNGIDASDQSGFALRIDNLNGDGINGKRNLNDIMIGTFSGDPNGSSSGETYVIFGNTDTWSASHNIADLLTP